MYSSVSNQEKERTERGRAEKADSETTEARHANVKAQSSLLVLCLLMTGTHGSRVRTVSFSCERKHVDTVLVLIIALLWQLITFKVISSMKCKFKSDMITMICAADIHHFVNMLFFFFLGKSYFNNGD